MHKTVRKQCSVFQLLFPQYCTQAKIQTSTWLIQGHFNMFWLVTMMYVIMCLSNINTFPWYYKYYWLKVSLSYTLSIIKDLKKNTDSLWFMTYNCLFQDSWLATVCIKIHDLLLFVSGFLILVHNSLLLTSVTSILI